MRYAPMRFDGMSLRHNPEKLVISGKNHIKEYTSPCCDADSINLGRELRRVSGEGELCGEDCLARYRALEQLQISGKRSKLLLSRMEPMYAYLKELKLKAEPVDNAVSYSFLFVEAQSPRGDRRVGREYLTALAGESLWDISYAFSTPIERLVSLNPHIPHIDSMSGGERVRLC